MAVYAEINDAIQGDKIYCTFRKATKPTVIGGSSRHQGQSQTIEGNPAVSIIKKKWKRI